jgi:hypothetical protein
MPSMAPHRYENARLPWAWNVVDPRGHRRQRLAHYAPQKNSRSIRDNQTAGRQMRIHRELIQRKGRVIAGFYFDTNQKFDIR